MACHGTLMLSLLLSADGEWPSFGPTKFRGEYFRSSTGQVQDFHKLLANARRHGQVSHISLEEPRQGTYETEACVPPMSFEESSLRVRPASWDAGTKMSAGFACAACLGMQRASHACARTILNGLRSIAYTGSSRWLSGDPID